MNDAVRQQGLEKAPTGIHGFDEISHGGLPRGHVTVVLGGAGTGKTVFALQALAEGARRFHEPGLFVAFEESSAQVVRNAANFGWPLTREEGIDFFDAHLSSESIRSGGFDIAALLAGVGVKARAIGAKRIVFDAIDVLLSLIGDRPREATELYRVRDWMEANGLTGIVTSRVPGADQSVTGWEAPSSVLLPFMADCVICLQKKTTQRIALRNLQIIKYRGSFHGQNEYGFVIGPSGIELSRLAFAETATSVPQEQVTTGVLRLDTMLRGGYYRGSSTLITGAPGTAKTTLAIAFANAACTRGERVLYIAFDESPRN